jgi:cyclophilin family peptidyl-prolyl cis-trans isomerase
MDTSMGIIEVELFSDQAPITVKNFLTYVNKQYYDGLIFHRTIKNFMIQGGGSDEDMNEVRNDRPIKNEAKNGLKNKRGTIAMARLPDVDSARSQFFIHPVDNLSLDHADDRQFGYCVFGQVVRGMDVVDKIASVKTTTRGLHDNVPEIPVVIKSIKLKE